MTTLDAMKAINLLNPDVSRKTLQTADIIAGNSEKQIKEIKAACTLACEALSQQVETSVVWEEIPGDNVYICRCPVCGAAVEDTNNYCYDCGQRLTAAVQ